MCKVVLCLACVLLVGCREYPHYAPVLVQAAVPQEADEKALSELELSFRFDGIIEKKAPASGASIPVATVGMRIRNQGNQPIKLSFADFTYQDHANQRFPLTAAHQSGKRLEQAILASGQSGNFDLQFDLPVNYAFGPSFRLYWKFDKEAAAVPVYTKFAVAARPTYHAPPASYYNPWSFGPYYGYPYHYYDPYPYYGYGSFGFSYGFDYHPRHHHGHRKHH